MLGPEAAEGFRVVGLSECAGLIKTAIERFPAPYPRDRAARKIALQTLRLTGEKRVQWDTFYEMDDRYYYARDQSRFEERLDEYVAKSGI